MLLPFDKLPDSTRVWVYPSVQPLSPTESDQVVERTGSFLEKWAAHGTPLTSGCTVAYNHFLVIGVDEAEARISGCAIDASVHAVKEVEKTTGLRFFGHAHAIFLKDNEVLFVPVNDLAAALAAGTWNEKTPTFNPTIQTKGDLHTRWLQPADQSWVRRYLVRAGTSS